MGRRLAHAPRRPELLEALLGLIVAVGAFMLFVP
jgi:hypothetical protein